MFLALGLVSLALTPFALGDEPAPPSAAASEDRGKSSPPGPLVPLYEGEPFDQITLDAANRNAVLKTAPLFPDRRLPDAFVKGELPRSQKLQFRFHGRDDPRQYEVPWGNVVRIELFEELVLREANGLVQQGAFDFAHGHFAWLLEKAPRTAGLAEGRKEFLFRGSAAAFRGKKFDEAIALLEELIRLDPQYRPNLHATLATLADQAIEGFLRQDDYRSARALIARLRADHGEEKIGASRWIDPLISKATAERDRARELAGRGNFREAREAVRKMLAIWPELPGGAELAGEIGAKYPLAIVGVTSTAPHADRADLANHVASHAARRIGGLLREPLCELLDAGPEGGEYRSKRLAWSASDDGLTIDLKLSPQSLETASEPFTAYDLAKRLHAAAEGAEQGAWGRLVERIEVVNLGSVRCRLRRRHVVPHGLLRLAAGDLPGEYVEEGPSSSAIQEENQAGNQPGNRVAERRFLLRKELQADAGSRPREIIERSYPDSREAIRALKRGEIDVVDRLFPADLTLLRGDSSVRVGRYALPTTHVLAPGRANRLIANTTFRRGLSYGIAREAILVQDFLGGSKIPGCRPASSPIPPGIDDSDPLGYAHDSRISPAPYEPQLAATLLRLGEREVRIEAEGKKEPPPAKEPLVLGHAAEEVPLAACQAIAASWELLGIECRLMPLPLGRNDPGASQCDLIYVEAAIWEPILDVRRLLCEPTANENQAGENNANKNAGNPGIRFSSACSPSVIHPLRQAEDAPHWQEARPRLLRLHASLADELPVIPLWHLYDHFACRADLAGLEDGVASLYQDAASWNLTGNGAEKTSRKNPGAGAVKETAADRSERFATADAVPISTASAVSAPDEGSSPKEKSAPSSAGEPESSPASTGNANTGNASTGNASTGNANTSNTRTPPQSATHADLPWEFQPYSVLIAIAAEETPTLSREVILDLTRGIRQSAACWAGPVWRSEMLHLSRSELDPIEEHAARSARRKVGERFIGDIPLAAAASYDKVLLLRVAFREGEFHIRAKEFDRRVLRWGPDRAAIESRPEFLADAGFRAIAAAFSPLGRVEESSGAGARLRIRGAGLIQEQLSLDGETGSRAIGEIRQGDLFRPYVRRNDRWGKPTMAEPVPHAWLQTESIAPRGEALCKVHAASRNPIAGRSTRRTERLALAERPSANISAIRWRLADRDDPRQPLEGYEILLKSADSEPALAATTDARGEASFRPRPGLTIAYIRSGDRAVARIPLVPPSEASEMETLLLPSDLARIEAEGATAGIRTRLLDLAARQQLLADRFRRRLEANDLPGAEKTLDQLRSMPGRNELSRELESTRDRLITIAKGNPRQIEAIVADARTALHRFLDPKLPDRLQRELSAAERD